MVDSGVLIGAWLYGLARAGKIFILQLFLTLARSRVFWKLHCRLIARKGGSTFARM